MEVRAPAIRNSDDAEAVVMKWIQMRHKVKRVHFRKVWKKGDTWVVDLEAEVKTGIFAKTKRSFKLRISGATGDVIGYVIGVPKGLGEADSEPT